MADCTQADYDINVAATEAAEAVAKYTRLTAFEAYDLIARYLHELADKHAPLEMDEARPVEMEENTRAERTCRDDNLGGSFVCSECGANVNDTYVGRSYIDDFGKRWYGTSNEHWFNYCPNCGARVVE